MSPVVQPIVHPLGHWIGFVSFVILMLALDLGVVQRKAHEISMMFVRRDGIGSFTNRS